MGGWENTGKNKGKKSPVPNGLVMGELVGKWR